MPKELNLKHEIGRKLFHLTSVLIVLIYHYFGKTPTLSFLTILLILFIEIEFVRIEWGKKLPFFNRFVRAKEKHAIGGEVFFLIGAIIAISVFNKEIACAAVLMTTFGDMAAALIGKAFGRLWIPGLKNRAVEGVLAELIVDIFIGCLFFTNWTVILVMAFTATIVETLVNKLDDNLLIPLFAGFNGQIVLHLLGII